MKPLRLRRALLVFALCTACGGTDPLEGIGPDCNPLGYEERCAATPLPSSVFLKDDPTSPTGVRVDFGPGTLPQNTNFEPANPAWFNRRDGFSANAPLIHWFPVEVNPANLPPVTDPSKSLDPASPTVVLDLETGERVVHFAELDMYALDPRERTLVIRPLVRLKDSHRYAVAIRKSLKAADGGDLPISPGFRALLDGTETRHPRLERVRPRYPEIFAALEAAGVPKDDLVAAWDFVTAEDDSIRADMIGGRDAVYTYLGDKGENAPDVTFRVDVMDVPSDRIHLRLRGTFKAPLLLTEGGNDDGVLARDRSGKPMVVGTIDAPFVALIPKCVETQPLPRPFVIYGHGLMGSIDETGGGYPQRFAEYTCTIVIGTEWRGMSTADVAAVVLAFAHIDNFPKVFEKLVQGVNQFVALTQVVRGKMAQSELFRVNGTPVIDPDRGYYYGISQGGIFGGTFMAHDPWITQGVLAVGAANYSLYFERSTNWPEYLNIMQNSYPDPRDVQINVYLMQMGWDLTDPVTTVGGVTGNNGGPFVPDTPVKKILMQVARGDSQVHNIGSDYQARLMGIPMLEPIVEERFGCSSAPGPLPSAYTFWNEGREPLPPDTNKASDVDNGTHGSLRKRRAVNDQIKHFFETGEIVQTCRLGGAPVACNCPQDPEICGPEI